MKKIKLSTVSYILTILGAIVGLITFITPSTSNNPIEGNYQALIVAFFILLGGGAFAGLKGKKWGKYVTIGILGCITLLGIMAGTAGLVFVVPAAVLIVMILLSK